MGEHTIGTDPDCEETQAGAKFCAPKIIKRKVAKSILHEDWNPKTIENDIALLRLDQPVPFNNDDPKLSNVLPVCLPWNEFDPGRDIESWAEEIAIVTGKETDHKGAPESHPLLFRSTVFPHIRPVGINFL